jgi:nucleotide-binding universal stress UspA family protein
MFERIVVPLDGSATARQALPQAEELAREQEATILLVHVIDLNHLDHYGLETVLGLPSLADQLAHARDAATGDLERTATALRERGASADIDVRVGNPVREIVAATSPSDLLVMSTHGRGGPLRWVLGSVAEGVIRHAPVPVMVIRAQRGLAQGTKEEIDSLLRQETYRPEELATLLQMDVNAIRSAAFAGDLPAQIIDHHIVSIARGDVISWLERRG